MLALLLKNWQIALVAVALGFGALEWRAHNAAEVARGRAEERAARADSTLNALKPQILKADTVFRRDTIRLTRTVARVDSLHDSILVHLSDTIRVKEYVQTSDSALRACTSTLHNCAAVQALLRQQVGALETKLAAVPVAQPRSCVNTGIVSGLLGALGGFGVAVIARHP